MSRHLAILLWATDPDRPHLCGAPFFLAAAAAAMDSEVEIYFTSRSVKLLVKGVAESLHAGPLQRETVYGFMQHAVQHGAKFFACSQAMTDYGIDPDGLIPELTGMAGAAAFVARCLDDEWTTLTF